ncbi:MAG: bifunctional serine/threonine-protein kinase/ABC transporter substrate-binding protein [Candidatus Eremiobacterota bacterium]
MLSAGDIIKGEYKVIKVIGNGGMGSIYLCSEVKDSNKKWALKELRLTQIQTEMQEKAIKHFEMEAEILSKLNHFNLPGVKEYFKENGNYYLIMEFIEGEDLGKLLDRSTTPFPEELVLKWGTQMATALYFLHIQKPHPIIYRDLKPSNIIVTPESNIKLIDFGIARFFQPGKKKDTIQMGSLGYAPPEQFGEGQTDERSDIYSLGVTLHQLLTKRDPAEADNPFKIPLVRTINKDVSIELERIIQRSTQFEAIRRYQKISELKRDLKSLYDEKLRKSRQMPQATQFPVSVQPPTIAISAVETERFPVQEKPSDVQSSRVEHIIEKKEPEDVCKGKIKEVSNISDSGGKNEETGKDKIKEAGKEKPDKCDEKEEKIFSVRSKKKKSLLATTFIIILFILLSVLLYYLKPPWVIKYLSFIPGFHSVSVPAVTPSPSPETLNLKEQALLKYNNGNFSGAIGLLNESLKNFPGDPEAMIMKSNIELALQGNDKFSLGLIVSGKGKYNYNREDMMKGAFLAQKEINSNLGVRGKMLNVEIINDFSDVNMAFNNISRIKTENFMAVIGPDDYKVDMSVAPLFRHSGMLQFTPCLSMIHNQKDRPFTFGLSPDGKSELKAIYKLIYGKLNKKKIATVYDIDTPYFFELNYIFKEEILSKERTTIINDVMVREDSVREQKEINRILDSLAINKPDVIVFFSSPYLIKQIAPEIRKKEKDVIFVTGHWAMSGQLLSKENNVTEGLLCLCPLLKDEEGFVKKYREVFSDSVTLRTIQVYDTLILLKEAINTRGFRREDIRSYLMAFNADNPYRGKSVTFYFSGRESHKETGWKVLHVLNHSFTVHSEI